MALMLEQMKTMNDSQHRAEAGVSSLRGEIAAQLLHIKDDLTTVKQETKSGFSTLQAEIELLKVRCERVEHEVTSMEVTVS